MRIIGKRDGKKVIIKNAQGTTEKILAELEATLKKLQVTEVVIK